MKRYAYNASKQMIHEGEALSQPAPVLLTHTAVSKAAAAECSVAAHGMESGFLVRIQGATGDWAAANGEWPITSTAAGTFTVPVNSAAFAEDFDGAIYCLAARTKDAVWKLKQYEYDVDGNMTAEKYPLGKTTAAFKWDDVATLSYQ